MFSYPFCFPVDNQPNSYKVQFSCTGLSNFDVSEPKLHIALNIENSVFYSYLELFALLCLVY